MSNRNNFCLVNKCGIHKGFYNDEDPLESLLMINYEDFFELPVDCDDFPYYTADSLLCGSCEKFAVSLHKIMGYSPYIIEPRDKRSFHVFCQVYRKQFWYYVDARGITSSFDEFMEVAKEFVKDEYVIRPVELDDLKRWEENYYYNSEAIAFSEAIINKYRECYSFD